MTSLRNKIIAGAIGLALTGTVGATAIMHDGGNAAEETTTTTTASTTTATTTTTSTTTATTTATTEEVTTTMTTTTATTTDEFIPVKTEPKPKRIRRVYEVEIKGNDMTIYEIVVNNFGSISLQYRRSEEKYSAVPTAMSLTDADGTEATIWGQGQPSIGFEGINPLSTTFTLKIAFEDLEEQTIEIVLPDEFKQE